MQVTNIPHGILQEFAVMEKSKASKRLIFVTVSRSCTAPRFTTPRLSLEAAGVFSTRIMKGSLALRSVISRSGTVQVFLTPSASVVLSPTSTRLTQPARCCQIFLNAAEGATGSLDFCHLFTWFVLMIDNPSFMESRLVIQFDHFKFPR